MKRFFHPVITAVVFGILWGCSAAPHSTEDLFKDKPVYELTAQGMLPWTMRDLHYDILLFKDYVVLKHSHNKYLLGIYDIHTGDTIKRAAWYGEGPDEYTFIGDLYKVNDSVFVTLSGNSNRYASFYNICRIAPDKPFHPFRKVDLRRSPKNSPGMVSGSLCATIRPGNDTLMCFQALDWKGEKMLGSLHPQDKEIRMFIDYPPGDDTEGLMGGPKSNVYQGPLTLDDTGTRLFYATYCSDNVDFLRVDPSGAILPIKQYRFSVPKFVVVDGINTAYDSWKAYDHYLDIKWDNNKVYLLTSTWTNMVESERVRAEAYRSLCETGKEKIYARIFVFTQEGEPLYTLRLDVNPNTILFLDGKLYALSANAEGDYELRFYDISQLK